MVIHKIAIAAILLCTSLSAFSQEIERGIHWGKDDSEQQEKKEEAQKEKYTMPVVPPMSELLEMHPKEIRKLFVEVHEYHVMKPTLETANEIQKLKAVMNKKARAAASVEQFALLNAPETTGIAEYAINPTARSTQRQERDNQITKRLIKDRNDYALIMLSQPGCGACTIQRNVLANFSDNYGWPIKVIDISKNQMAKERFGITVTPTTLLVAKSGDWKTVAIGADALSTLVSNIDRTIRWMTGEIQPEQWLTAPNQMNSLYDPSFKE